MPNWTVFTYSLPTQSGSSPRVALWRRLRRLGAVSLTGSAYILPAQDECIEAFQWLAQEVEHAGGQALLMCTDQFERRSDQEIVDLFQQARAEEYEPIAARAGLLERELEKGLNEEARTQIRGQLSKLAREAREIRKIDYFRSPHGEALQGRIARLNQMMAVGGYAGPEQGDQNLESFRTTRWVTRPRPHVDRLSCAWLIRRFINADAEIRYGDSQQPGEVAFDMNEGLFRHVGNRCTFEGMGRAFGLDDPALAKMAEIVHEIDLRDGRYTHPEVEGVEAVLQGWLRLDLKDTEIESRGLALFDGLFATFSAEVSR